MTCESQANEIVQKRLKHRECPYEEHQLTEYTQDQLWCQKIDCKGYAKIYAKAIIDEIGDDEYARGLLTAWKDWLSNLNYTNQICNDECDYTPLVIDKTIQDLTKGISILEKEGITI